jgi:glycosyltransferase involved in cell wall biosynthesis
MARARLLVVTPSLGGGGAERHLIRILPALAFPFDVEIAVLRSGGTLAAAVPDGVPVHDIGSLGWVTAARRLRALVRGRRLDVVLSFQEAANIPALLALRLIAAAERPRAAVSIQSAPSVVLADARPRTRWRVATAMRRLYPLADRVIVASQGVAGDIASVAPGAAGRITCIYNAGIDASVAARAREAYAHRFFGTGEPVLVACGRLTEQKDYPTLLRAVARIRTERPVRLIVLGDGPLERDLTALTRALDIEDAVDFTGYVDNPYACMARASIYVLSSRSEGFGNVIVEALAPARPIVATDCPHGPGEILDRGDYGRLVPPGDPEAFARAVLGLLDDPQEAARLGALGPGRATLFTAERAGEAYASLLTALLAGRAVGIAAEL